MSSALEDVELLAAVHHATAETIGDVIGIMRRIDRACDDEDGLKWFNRLYLMVTEEIEGECRNGAWESPHWLVTLDVEFAKLYFSALAQWIRDPISAPRAWAPLFARRRMPGVAKVQFMLAGLNAHINRDLFLAVIAACEAHGSTPSWFGCEHRDYVRINHILDRVEVRAMQEAATGSIRRVSQAIAPFDRVLVMACISRIRALAWMHARAYLLLGGWTRGKTLFLRAIDRATGFLGEAVLVPTAREGKRRYPSARNAV